MGTTGSTISTPCFGMGWLIVKKSADDLIKIVNCKSPLNTNWIADLSNKQTQYLLDYNLL